MGSKIFRGFYEGEMLPAANLSMPKKYWPEWFGVVDAELLQFTDLKDKNGVDIYKSDRLRYRLFHTNQKVETIVIWNDDFATFGTEEDKLFDWLRYHNLIEVIGNIHQT